MIKCILVQIGERTETRVRLIPAEYTETGELISETHEETYTVTVPIMQAQNVEMTAEEVAEMQRLAAEMQRLAAEMPPPEPTVEERLADVQTVSDNAYINSELALALLDAMEV